jgi:phage terminase large subunit GpA-like protein
VIFVGPAQSGKTDALILNWTLYSVKVDPMDIIIYSPTTAAARDFSLRRIDRLNRHSPEVGKLLMKGRTADNRLDKHYSTGTFLSLSHPSQTE